MRCTAVYRPGISVAKCVAHDCDIGDVPCLTARIADLEAAIARMHRAVPGAPSATLSASQTTCERSRWKWVSMWI